MSHASTPDVFSRLVAALTMSGCRRVKAGEDGAEMWTSPVTKGDFVLPRNVKSRHKANDVLKQTGLPPLF